MRFIDAAIPLVGGILLLLYSEYLSKKRSSEQDQKKRDKLRVCGLGLIAVSAIYFFVSLSRQ